MNASLKIVAVLVVLFLAIVPLLATTWSAPDALAADDTSLWSSPDVLAKIQPGFNNDELKQIADGSLEQVRKNLQNNGITYSYERAYRIYSMANCDIIGAFEEKGSLAECFSTEYQWHVPLVSGRMTTGTAKLSTGKDGNWQVISYGTAQLEECGLLSDLAKISRLLTNAGLKNITDIKAAYLPMYHTTMLYIEADGQEYAIAANEARFTDIVTYKIYTAKDFVGAFERAFGRPLPFDPNTPLEEIPIGIPGAKTK